MTLRTGTTSFATISPRLSFCSQVKLEAWWTLTLLPPDSPKAAGFKPFLQSGRPHSTVRFPRDPTSSTASQFTKLGSFTKTNSTRLSSRPFLTMFPAPPPGQFAQAQAAARVARAHDCLVLSSFSVLQAALHKGTFKSIAVPNRLYAAPNKEKPLAGARISIKGNYDLEGIRTTMMNRAYNELYPPRASSADFAIKLTQLGAIIVGKTKMSAFTSAEEPTDQWVDYHCPFNPRGDMYQTPSCSSAGAGASLAGYPWLDHSIGSDSTFSFTLPCPLY